MNNNLIPNHFRAYDYTGFAALQRLVESSVLMIQEDINYNPAIAIRVCNCVLPPSS